MLISVTLWQRNGPPLPLWCVISAYRDPYPLIATLTLSETQSSKEPTEKQPTLWMRGGGVIGDW